MMKLRSYFDWVGGYSLFVLIAVLIVIAGIWGFVELADEVSEGDTKTFDEWAIRALRSKHCKAS